MTRTSLRQFIARLPGARALYHAWKALAYRQPTPPPAALDQKQLTAHHWGAQNVIAEQKVTNWLNSVPVLRGYVYTYLANKTWFEYLQKYCTPPRNFALSLCCGSGEVERFLLNEQLCVAGEGVDLAPGAISLAQQAAQANFPTLSYRVADVEHILLEAQRYDLVLGWIGLHHLTNLPHVFQQVHQALRPEGIFVVNEYVGPRKFQLTQEQVRLINEGLAMLPDELNRLPSGELRGGFTVPSLAEIDAADPSEAISSHRILPLLEQHFTIVERIDYGGALLQWILKDIVFNFDPQQEAHQQCLTRLFEFERAAMREGRVGSDFSFVIATR